MVASSTLIRKGEERKMLLNGVSFACLFFEPSLGNWSKQ